jgi:AbrB family looped-hinge helix DNA binding protein
MNQPIQVSLDELGHIFVPASLREKLHLSPGMTLVVEKGEKGGVQLRVASQPTTLVEKDGMLVARVTALGDLANATRNERDRRVFDLLQRVGL